MRKHTRTPFSNQRNFMFQRTVLVLRDKFILLDFYSVTSQDISTSDGGGSSDNPDNPDQDDSGTAPGDISVGFLILLV